MAVSTTAQCVVCEHVSSAHVMHAGSIRDWRGDYCTRCQKWCKQGDR